MAVAPVTCWYWSYWNGVPHDGLEVYVRGKRVLLVFPTDDSLTAVFIGWAAPDLDAVRSNIQGEFITVVDRVPALAERVRGGRREECFFGATDVPNFIWKPAGPGWALVGDAECHKERYLALGTRDALRDAELLADALDDALSGRMPYEVAMAVHERRRNTATPPASIPRSSGVSWRWARRDGARWSDGSAHRLEQSREVGERGWRRAQLAPVANLREMPLVESEQRGGAHGLAPHGRAGARRAATHDR
jgi:hypothetical protein